MKALITPMRTKVVLYILMMISMYPSWAPAQSSCIEPPADLVGWWTFDEAQPGIVFDASGQGNHGTHVNGPTIVLPGHSAEDRALSFDGIDDYIEVPDSPSLNVGGGDFTIDAWIKVPADATGHRIIIDKLVAGAHRVQVRPHYYRILYTFYGYSFQIINHSLALQVAWPQWYFSTFNSGSSISSDEWHFVAVTVDRNNSTGIRFYVDGQQRGQLHDPRRFYHRSLSFNQPLRVGSRSTSVSWLFKGDIDEVEIYKRALTAQDILDIYENGKCKTSICGTKFDDLNNNGINDGEPGLSGWTINITNSDGTVAASEVTGADGSYCFTGLPPGAYTVTEELVSGWTQTAPSGGMHSVQLEIGDFIDGLDFGNQFVPLPKKVIWVSEVRDVDQDGIQDDQGFIDLFINAGYDLDVRLDYWTELDTTKIDELEAADLVFISRASNSNFYDEGSEIADWNRLHTPLLLMNTYHTRPNRWQWFSGSDTTTEILVPGPTEVLYPNHPIFAGLTLDQNNMIQLHDSSVGTGLSNFTPSPDAGNGIVLARNDDGKISIVEWTSGAAFYTGAAHSAGSHRLFITAGTQEVGATPWGAMNLNAAGQQMLLNAVDYMLQ